MEYGNQVAFALIRSIPVACCDGHAGEDYVERNSFRLPENEFYPTTINHTKNDNYKSPLAKPVALN